MSDALSLVVSILLLVTAALKTFNTAVTAALQSAYDFPTWLMIAAVQAELVVAFLLLSGWNRRIGWRAALSLFSVFAMFSLYRTLAGYESCGCFGPFEVNPWWTFGLDAAVLSLLVVQRQAFLGQSQHSPSTNKLLAGAAGYALLGGLSFGMMAWSAPTNLRAEESLLSDTKLVVLKPTEWIDQKFPLNDEISPRIDVSEGKSVVLLFHHDCPKCQTAIPRYEQLAAELAVRGGTVLLVEVPPYGESFDDAGQAKRAQLSADREWFVQAPVEIQLTDGMVQLASLELPSVFDSP